MDILGTFAGKRTYIVAFLTALVALLSAFDINLPGWVNQLLLATGLTTLRAALPPAPGK